MSAFEEIPLDPNNFSVSSQVTSLVTVITNQSNITDTTTNDTRIESSSVPNGLNLLGHGNITLVHAFDSPQFLSRVTLKWKEDSGSLANLRFFDTNGDVIDPGLGAGTSIGSYSTSATAGDVEQHVTMPHQYDNPKRISKFTITITPNLESSLGIGINYIRAFSARDALTRRDYNIEINDSEFEREGWKNARYKGTKLTAAKINKYTRGDITFGTKPLIEQYSKTVYVFNQADNSFGVNSGIFYPETDEFEQTLSDKQIIGSVRFKLDRAVTFNIDDPSDFSQIQPGKNDPDDPSFNFFDTLVKTDLALFNSCSVRFFNNANNGFVKSRYTIGYNRGEFLPAAAYFTDEEGTATAVGAVAGESKFDYQLNNDGRLYINPNVEDWFIAQTGASGSQGTLDEGNTAITINHQGSSTAINSVEGYFHNLSKRLIPGNDSYYISFNSGKQGIGTLNEKNLLKALDIHELADSGSNIDLSNNKFNTKTLGRYASTFSATYDGSAKARSEEFVLFRERKSNNVVHLDFNLPVEAPAGVGNGGIIIPDNLHPKIKESLNVFLSNAGLGAQGGTSGQFSLGGVTSITRRTSAPQQISVRDDNDDVLEGGAGSR